MGQYHLVVNPTKREFLDPHQLGDGLKLMEFGLSAGGTMTALALLLAAQCADGPRGGGDPRVNDPGKRIGSWAGDGIVIAGDYAALGDAAGWVAGPGEEAGSALYDVAREEYKDVSAAMRLLIEEDGDVVFTPTLYGFSRT